MAELATSINLDPDTGSILVVRLKALGDIALTVPLLNSLRRSFPGARIDYLCLEGYGQTLRGNGDIDNVIEFRKHFTSQARLMLRLRRESYHVVLDLISSPRSAMITWFAGARLRIGMDVGRHNFCYHKVLPRTLTRNGEPFKCYTMDANREIARMLNLEPDKWSRSHDRYRTGFPPSSREEAWAREYLSRVEYLPGHLIGVVPAAKYQAKGWPLDRFVDFILLLKGDGYTPVLIWGPGEKETADMIEEKTGAVKPPLIGIARLGALIKGLDCLVGVDSGPKHLAVMQGVPTVTLFGPTDPEVWDPMNEKHRVLRRELECSPCGMTDCSEAVCMNGIGADELMEELRKVLGSERGG
ncbi:MAG: hypothetical protein GF417_02735 [Candidatus Latescibacteria bacterium]|nr:hypothetical protein [bacterium]MBD3423346.1 hypothetical protein [Candidatus Latescibacterota bacterium]